MNFKPFLLFLISISLISCKKKLLTKRETLPNVIYILTDDLGYGDVKYLNPDGKIDTPQMDHLASQGMIFTDAHTSSSVCTPSRYSIITGRYNWRTKLQKGVLWGFSPPLIENNRLTVANFLQNQGYHTACFGKWHLGMDLPFNGTPAVGRYPKKPNVNWKGTIKNGPTDRGFDTFYGISASLDMPPYIYIQDDKFIGECEMTLSGKKLSPKNPEFKAVDVLSKIGEKTIDYIKNYKGDKPFFTYVAFTSPHTPILPSKEWVGKSELGKYGDFVMQTDDVIGKIVNAVDEMGLTENTIIIVTSDNGCSKHAGISDMIQKGHYPSGKFRGSKADLWEGGHRVPFIVRWPKEVTAGTKSNETICLTDFFSTMSEITKQNIPNGFAEDSYSFLPALKGKKIISNRKGIIHHSVSGHFAYRQGKWKLLLAKGSGGWSSPRENEAKTAPKVQLYNLENDPGETTNLYKKHPEIVEKLLEQLKSDVYNGHTTKESQFKNDIEDIVLWKSGNQ
ncbi:arylsulfatase [Wenyingzhuangia sp. 2_MG-2023]|uniref:sulfatase family protein n=1 Tax=Wenyingzhuangia sp. 2_MG-2023 TaxID=3062639 RepID=UPI0026E3A11A|nr:arylsulfatase [Wenyingzhuangia sp. 2_MG-2023]MDO6736285.1 arylsulfatase [Wenyingzhuangia sp. 2_MG-2023]MDO6801411.1 arylsulfatase [Wenyingzhuangia sp. 1_MG-2023]